MKIPSLRTRGLHPLRAAPTPRSPRFPNSTPALRVQQTDLRSRAEFRLKLNLSLRLANRPSPHPPTHTHTDREAFQGTWWAFKTLAVCRAMHWARTELPFLPPWLLSGVFKVCPGQLVSWWKEIKGDYFSLRGTVTPD